MPRPPLWYLQKVELFSDLSTDELKDIVQDMYEREVPNGQIIYTAQEYVCCTHILLEGEVTLYKTTADGKRIILDVLKPGAVFGNFGFDPNTEDSGHFAETTQSSYIVTLPEGFFIKLMKMRPDIAMHAFSLLTKRLTQYETQLKFLSMLGAKERILATVRLINEKDDHSILPEILRKPTKITHEKLANMTGLTRETVTKQLQKMISEGLINADKKHLRITAAGIQLIQSL